MSLPKYGESPYFGIFYLKIDYLKINNDIMTLYSKWFNTHNEYEAYKNGQDYILPNVSICYNDLDVHYEKENDPYNGHEYVDLGLPSGTLWAKCNVGAETETDYGLYFQWGDTQGYASSEVGSGSGQKAFAWADYKFNPSGDGSTFTKYNSSDGKTTLDIEDDAARVNMGGEWQMSTKADFEELIAATSSEATTINGVAGYLFTSKTNGNTLFIPYAGFAHDSRVNDSDINSLVWSSSLNDGGVSSAYFLLVPGKGGPSILDVSRHYGHSVRGVVKN